jgi:hypothetical protein
MKKIFQNVLATLLAAAVIAGARGFWSVKDELAGIRERLVRLEVQASMKTTEKSQSNQIVKK